MGSAQLDNLARQDAAHSVEAPSEPHPSRLRQQAAERLQAHRERRRNPPPQSAAVAVPSKALTNPIAAAVRERYAQTPSYRAILAEQAQRAVDEATRHAKTAALEAESAAAEAEIQARNAHAILSAQQELLAELDLWTTPQQFTAQQGSHRATVQPVPATRQTSRTSLSVRHADEIVAHPRTPVADAITNEFPQPGPHDAEEARALDEEIAFRQEPASIRLSDPFTIEPSTPLPANLLEFPRQLVATRRVRPRHAEGPLAETSSSAARPNNALPEEPPPNSQLRIFEVEPVAAANAADTLSPTPEWASIYLDAQVSIPAEDPAVQPADSSLPTLMATIPLPQTAPIHLRLMAVTLDLATVAAAFVGFVAVSAQIAQTLPSGLPAAIIAAVVLVCFYAVYQVLFFTFSDQTPGMRYARIGFCSFNDENPSRSAIRRRLLALLIALCPLGLGILWSLLDEDGLGWHDRISRMYPRPY